jgi:hypothetical protein
MEVKFQPPDGDDVENPTKEYLERILLHEGKDFWCVGSGTGVFAIGRGDDECSLVLVFHPTHGFHLSFSETTRRLDWLVPKVSADLRETTVVTVGGEPTRLPVAFFVSRRAAMEAVEAFMESGTPTKALNWGAI